MAAPVAETNKQKLIGVVNSIVRQIGAKEKLGTERDVVITDQAKSLLHTFSKLNGIELDTMNAVSDDITRTGLWDLT